MAWIHPAYLGVAAVALLAGAWLARRRGRRSLWVSGGVAGVIALLGSVAFGVPWIRAQPAALRVSLYAGVNYERSITVTPRPMVIHVLRIDLAEPSIRFLVTPPELPEPTTQRARTTSSYLRESGAQVAINGAFFSPFHATSPWNFYPTVGAPARTWGFAMSSSVPYSEPRERAVIVSIDDAGRVRFHDGPVPEGVRGNALSGQRLLPRVHRRVGQPQPRTALGLDRGANELILVVVDGRQPTYSEGASLTELSAIMAELGADEAISLDGGGSSTMVDATRGVLNSPIHTEMVGRERPVANHLVVFAGQANDSEENRLRR